MIRHKTPLFDVVVLLLMVYLVTGCAREAWGQCYTLPNGQQYCPAKRPCPQVSPDNTSEMSAPGPWAQGFSGIQITGPAGNTAVAGVVGGQNGQVQQQPMPLQRRQQAQDQQPARWVTSESKPSQDGKPTSISHPAVCYVELVVPATNEPWQRRSDGSYIRKSADTYAGSGVLVSKTGDGSGAGILTAWHTLKVAQGNIRCTFYVGGYAEYPATLVSYDANLDVALLSIRPTEQLPEPVPVGTSNPLIGEAVTLGGFGNGQFRMLSGRMQGWSPPWMLLSGATTLGDSGGPVFNAQGKLVGILWGNDGTAYAVPCTEFVPKFWPEWYASQNTLPVGGNAMPGSQVPSLPATPAGGGVAPPATTPPAIPPTAVGTGSPPLPAIDPDGDGQYTAVELQRIEAGLVAVTDEVEALGRRLDEHLANPTPAPSIDAITEAVIKRLPPITVVVRQADGTTREQKLPLGGRLVLAETLETVPTPGRQ